MNEAEGRHEHAPTPRDDERHGAMGASRPSLSPLCDFPRGGEYQARAPLTGWMHAEAKRLRSVAIHAGGLAIFTAGDIAELHRRHAKRTGR